MNSFSLIVSFFTCSDIKTHIFVNISHKNMTFSTLSYYLYVLLLLQKERTAFSCFAIIFCRRNIIPFITSLLCYISSLHIFFFSNGLLSSWLPISLRSSLWHILQYFGGLPCLSLLSNALLSLFIRYRICP